jgi:hypothetical protein
MQWLSYLQMFLKRPIVGEAVRARFVLGIVGVGTIERQGG